MNNYTKNRVQNILIKRFLFYQGELVKISTKK